MKSSVHNSNKGDVNMPMMLTLPEAEDTEKVRDFLRSIDVEPINLYPEDAMKRIYCEVLRLVNREPGQALPNSSALCFRYVYDTIAYTLANTK